MTTTCLINNYNYARFLGEALDSTLAQTVPFDEIIVVDDGSSDESVELLARRCAQHPTIQMVAKQNQGQLSCFNEGFARSKGDIVFFLDGDDAYEPTYAERVLDAYHRDPGRDFVYCGHRQFGQGDGVKLDYAQDRDLGYSVILATYLRQWIGAPTSCLSMRRRVLEQVLPLPFAEDWRTRADDCLVFGASLAGARKYFLAQPLVRYRVHGDNGFHGRVADRFATYRRRLAINKLFHHLERKFAYDVIRLADFHHREFRTIAKPTFRMLRQYVGIGMASHASLLRRLACVGEMTLHYLKSATRSAADADFAALPEHGGAPPLRVFPSADAAQPAGSEILESRPQATRQAA
jgi:glycosyltransferase involved in cell wall biosynthesis